MARILIMEHPCQYSLSAEGEDALLTIIKPEDEVTLAQSCRTNGVVETFLKEHGIKYKSSSASMITNAIYLTDVYSAERFCMEVLNDFKECDHAVVFYNNLNRPRLNDLRRALGNSRIIFKFVKMPDSNLGLSEALLDEINRELEF